LTVTLSYRCAGAPSRLTIRDDSFDVFGEHHQTIARVDTSAGVREAAFSTDARDVTLALGADARPTLAFVRLGVGHILTGWDHLLFLAALLLGGGGAVALLKIVTAFTIAHSVSLAAAVLGVVHVADRVVESVIAASIAWVAIENVVRRAPPVRRWLTSFVFGLVHGLGFASALTPLALPTWSLAGALVGFNVGVEAGQAAVIALALPAFLWLRGREVEPRVRRGLSIGAAAIGIAWFVWRLFIE
jgi:hydrogenase/urease accessory protein HupE